MENNTYKKKLWEEAQNFELKGKNGIKRQRILFSMTNKIKNLTWICYYDFLGTIPTNQKETSKKIGKKGAELICKQNKTNNTDHNNSNNNIEVLYKFIFEKALVMVTKSA